MKTLNSSNGGVKGGDIHIAFLGFADELVLITDCPKKAKSLRDICQSWPNDNIISFNTSNFTVMVLNGPSTDTSLKLFDGNPEIVYSYKYLGLTLAAKRITNFFKNHFSFMREKARI